MLSARNFPEGQRDKKNSQSIVNLFLNKGFNQGPRTKCIDVQLVDEIPQPLDHILDMLHAFTLKTKTTEDSNRRQQYLQSSPSNPIPVLEAFGG